MILLFLQTTEKFREFSRISELWKRRKMTIFSGPNNICFWINLDKPANSLHQ